MFKRTLSDPVTATPTSSWGVILRVFCLHLPSQTIPSPFYQVESRPVFFGKWVVNSCQAGRTRDSAPGKGTTSRVRTDRWAWSTCDLVQRVDEDRRSEVVKDVESCCLQTAKIQLKFVPPADALALWLMSQHLTCNNLQPTNPVFSPLLGPILFMLFYCPVV